MVRIDLPRSLKTLSVFEDFDDSLADLFINPWDPADHVRIADSRVAADFAYRSVRLEQLSVSYLANAEDFFRACLHTWTWEHLRSLALTSTLLQPTESRGNIYALLSRAAAVALQMPRLHTLVLWNGRRGNACAFIYHRQELCRPRIEWRSRWDLKLPHAVVEAWQTVASQADPSHDPSQLGIEKQYIQGEIYSHADAIHHLALPCPVVAPASLCQMRREGAYRALWYN